MGNLSTLGNLGYSNPNSFRDVENLVDEVEKIVDAKGDDNCGFYVIIVEHLGHGEDIHYLICLTLLRELNLCKSDYMSILAPAHVLSISEIV